MASEDNVAKSDGHVRSELISQQSREFDRVHALAGFIRADQKITISQDAALNYGEFENAIQIAYIERDAGFNNKFDEKIKFASDTIMSISDSDRRNDLITNLVDIHLEHGNIQEAYKIIDFADILTKGRKVVDIYRWQETHVDYGWIEHEKEFRKELLSVKRDIAKGEPALIVIDSILETFLQVHSQSGHINEAADIRNDLTDKYARLLGDIHIAEAYYASGDKSKYQEICTKLEQKIVPQNAQKGSLPRDEYITMLIKTDNLEVAYEQVKKNDFIAHMSGIAKYVDIAERYATRDVAMATQVINIAMRSIKGLPSHQFDIHVMDRAMHIYMAIIKPDVHENIFLQTDLKDRSAIICTMQILAAHEYLAQDNISAAKTCTKMANSGESTNASALSSIGKDGIVLLSKVYEALGESIQAKQVIERWLDEDERAEFLHEQFLSSTLANNRQYLLEYLHEINIPIQQKNATFRMDLIYKHKSEILQLLGDGAGALDAAKMIEASPVRYNRYRSILIQFQQIVSSIFDEQDKNINFDQLRFQFINTYGALNRILLRDIGIIVQNAETVQRVLDMLPSSLSIEAKFLMYREATQFKTEFAEIGKNTILEDTKNQLRKSLDAGQTDHISDLTQILVNLTTKEAGDILLTHSREQYEKDFSSDPRLITLFASALTELNTFRGNDLVFAIASDKRISPQVSKFLYDRLIRNGYLSKDIQEWLDEQNKNLVGSQRNEKLLHEAQQIESIKIISRAGILPSRDVLTFLVNEPWQDGELANVIDLQERIELVKTYLGETDKTTDSTELVKMLHSDRKIAMAYYIQHNREIRFDLVNNYSFEKFWDILGIIDSLEVHETPLNEFAQSLSRAGFTQEQIEPMIANLRNGHHPWFSEQESEIGESILLDVSNQQVYEQKMLQLQYAFGSEGLGTCLISPFLRKHLEDLIATKGNNFEQAQKLLIELNQSSGIANRAAVIFEIKNTFSEFLQPIYDELSLSWNELRSKLSIAQIDIVDVLNNQTPAVSPESLIYAVEDRRHNLKSAKKELIAALQLENPQIRSISQEIRKKRKAAQSLRLGLQRNPKLQPQIDEIEHEVESLETQLSELGSASVVGRYENEAVEVRNRMLDDAKKEFETLSTKDTAPILVYMIAELIEHMPILESDSNVMKEVSSHLSDPMTAISQLRDVRNPRSTSEQLKNIQLAYVDKHKDLMRMVRFADSKICCFSSSNYDMRVAHNTENKYWVASINKDPLSFVFELQDPDTKNNTGFIFGSFGIDEDGYPAILLNGIYLSSGNTKGSVNNILDSIEKNFARRIRAKTIAISNIYGGKMSQMPNGYTESDIVLRRLRALDDGSGNPETKIYDDLSQAINGWKSYGSLNDETLAHEGTVFHKRINN